MYSVKVIMIFGVFCWFFGGKSADVILYTNSSGRYLSPPCPPTFCLGDLVVVTCTTNGNGTIVQSWSSSITSPAPSFVLGVSLVGDTVGLANNSMAVFVVYLKAVNANFITSTLSITISTKIFGAVVQCADKTQGSTGVRVASLLIQQFNAPSSPVLSPQPISNIMCTSPNGVSLTVQWSPPGDVCGDPSLYYNVTSPQLGPLCPYLPQGVTSCDISGLSVNVSYDVQVRAVNCVGISPPLVIPVQIPGRVPDPVTFNPTCLSPSQIQVTWKLPAPVAPVVPIGQVAMVTCLGPGCVITASSPTSAILSGVVGNGTYTVGVSLRNCVGGGAVVMTNDIVVPLMQSQNDFCVPEIENNTTSNVTGARSLNTSTAALGQASCLVVASVSSAVVAVCSFTIGVLVTLSMCACYLHRYQGSTLEDRRKHGGIVMEDNTAYGTHATYRDVRRGTSEQAT